jgi:cellulose synthase/poly-beta-1,6-N-acetylglucosamine synthase-like glycosyltransferase
VPAGSPLTKARALNFGLKFVRGKYLTVYDAEDIPHPSQLKIMVEQFSQAGDEIACLQAKLGMFNQKENLLTKYFAIEYSIWFDFILPGLERTKLLQPLGGTSNHFITSKLKQIGGWDAYNVTEDADLGVRLALHNYRIKMIESVTLEEAPIYVGNWLRQRSRWIKGYIQTYFVHMRDYKNLYNKLKLRGFLSFQLLLGLPNLIFLFNPLMWAIYCSYQFGIGHNEIYLYKYLARFWEFNFLFSYFSSLAYAFTSIRRNNWANSWWNFIIFPFYYSLHNIASIKSFWQLLTNPHYWEKTTHGETALNPSDK